MNKAVEQYKNCSSNNCQNELIAVDAILQKFNDISTKLYIQFEKGLITRKVYDNEMKKINKSLNKTKEKLSLIKCTLEHCEKESRMFLRTFINDSKETCQTQTKCKEIAKDLKSTNKKLSLQTYKQLQRKYM